MEGISGPGARSHRTRLSTCELDATAPPIGRRASKAESLPLYTSLLKRTSA